MDHGIQIGDYISFQYSKDGVTVTEREGRVIPNNNMPVETHVTLDFPDHPRAFAFSKMTDCRVLDTVD